MNPHGIFRITSVAPLTAVANPDLNATRSVTAIEEADTSDLIVLPELGLTGYTCGDLFATDALLAAAIDALEFVTDHSVNHRGIVVAGLPLRVSGSLMNVAAVIAGGRVHGIVPKTFLPNYREFYEARHFRAACETDPRYVTLRNESIPFGTDLLFRTGDATIGIEICEDLWTPIPPSSRAAVAGANVLVNLSASNETIGKSGWRRDLVNSQSGRCIAAYAYASAGPGESTSDLVFGGHCVIAENGVTIGESRRVGDGLVPDVTGETSVTADVDLQRLAHDRQVVGSFDDVRDQIHCDYRVIEIEGQSDNNIQTHDTSALTESRFQTLHRRVDGQPFVPSESTELDSRCAEILALQTAGLVKRLSRLPIELPLSIGVSGGLDSTLALLVALRACQSTGRDPSAILGITMPGFGTTGHTRTSADRLIELTEITPQCTDIRALCLDTFHSLDHHPLGIAIDSSTTVDSLQSQLLKVADDATDLVFENVQARVRTMLLMNSGFVLGTGDMSEQALGWCTYNADHMSMYNVNTSVPKTLVRFLVRFAADHYFDGELRDVLHRVADTPISPELLPPNEQGEIRQNTEDSIGAYELHDFILFHFIRNGFSREKIEFLAQHADFSRDYSETEIQSTVDMFLKRFFANQFKRNCVPDGPKIGSVSLSPRGDWRMPSDADPDAFAGQ